jgi:membrane-associated phospholipid phosphatase
VRRRGSRLALAVGVVSVAASYLVVRSEPLAARERVLADRLRRPRGPRFDTAVSVATDLGSLYAVAGASTALAASGRSAAALDVAGAGILAWSAAQVLKVGVGRPRPYQAEGVERLVAIPAGTSWPSGHPAVAAACASVVAPSIPPPARRVAAAGAVLVALSRVYVGVHYPSDVAAGLGVGMLAGAGGRRLRR